MISGQPEEALFGVDASALQPLRHHRLTPWLYWEIARNSWEKYIPYSALIQELRRDYIFSLKTATRQQEMTLWSIREFSRRGIEVILLKGADLRLRLYDDPATRPMDDFDLLIDPKVLPRARSMLAQLGFRLSPEYVDLTPGYWELLGEAVHYLPPPGKEFSLDLHWEIGALGYFYRIPFVHLRKDALPFFKDDLSVYVLSPENLIVLLCLNAFKERNNPILCKVLDLVLALSSLTFNWRTVTDRAGSFKCQRPVYVMLGEIARFAPQLVPQEVLDELAKYQPSLAELMVLHGPWRYLNLGIPSFYRHRSLRDWLKVVKATLWPDADYLMAVYQRADRVAYFKDLWRKLFPQEEPGPSG